MIQNVENPPFESIMAAKISIIQQPHNLVFPIWLVSKMADCQSFWNIWSWLTCYNLLMINPITSGLKGIGSSNDSAE